MQRIKISDRVEQAFTIFAFSMVPESFRGNPTKGKQVEIISNNLEHKKGRQQLDKTLHDSRYRAAARNLIKPQAPVHIGESAEKSRKVHIKKAPHTAHQTAQDA